MHYRRVRKTGDTGPAEARKDLRDSACSVCGSSDGRILHHPLYPDGRGLCEMHYARWRKFNDVGPVESLRQKSPLDGECAHRLPDGSKCQNPYLAAGYCSMHYQRLRVFGDPDDPGVQVRIPDDQAAEQMRDAGASPQVSYPGVDKPWPCICVTCSRHVTPTLSWVRQGGRACPYCSGSKVDPEEAAAFMLAKGLRVTVPYPGTDKPWPGIHVGTPSKRGCNQPQQPSYHAVKTGGQGVCFDCATRGYSRSLPGALYIVESDALVKVGIANMRGLSRRLNKHAGQGLQPRVVYGFADGAVPAEFERLWVNWRSQHEQWQVSKSDLPDGYTEAMVRCAAVDDFIGWALVP